MNGQPFRLLHDRILELSGEGLHYYKIADILGRSRAGVYNYMKLHNIDRNCNKHSGKCFAKHNQIISLLADGNHIDDIADKLGINRSTLKGYAYHKGISYKRRSQL